MFEKLKKIIGYFIHLRTSKLLLSIMNNSYLKDMGWLNSEFSEVPADKDNNPIPWITHSYTNFPTPFLSEERSVFELGAGYSTLSYASKVKSVISVDHDESWIKTLKKRVLKNVSLYHYNLNSGYTTSINNHNKLFDIIIIGGRKRVECVKNSFDKITARGVIVLDNSEREYYKEGIDFLKEKGFKKIDLWGISPGYIHNKCKTLFCKDFNSFLS